MKRILKNTIKVLLLSTVVFSSISIATAQKKAGYTLKGTMTDLPSGKIYLEHTIDKKTIKDSTDITNGNFEFKGSTSEPIFYTLYLSDKKNSKSFLMENAAISFVGKKDSLYKAKVKGSKVNDIYIRFYEVDWKPVTAKAGDIYGRMDKAEKAGTMKSDPSVRKGFDAEFSALSLLNDSIVNAYAKRNSASVASAVVIFDRYISYPYFDNARALMPFLSKEVKESSFGKQIT